MRCSHIAMALWGSFFAMPSENLLASAFQRPIISSTSLRIARAGLCSFSHSRHTSNNVPFPIHLMSASVPSLLYSKRAEQGSFQPSCKTNTFNLNVGKVIDTLQADYPYILQRSPDFSIYSDAIVFENGADGVSLRGIAGYKRMFDVVRLMRHLVHGADVKHRLVYDPVLRQVRMRWNLKMWMRPQTGGDSVKPMEMDGISIYCLDDEGMVMRHNLEFKERINPREMAPVVNWGLNRMTLDLAPSGLSSIPMHPTSTEPYKPC